MILWKKKKLDGRRPYPIILFDTAGGSRRHRRERMTSLEELDRGNAVIQDVYEQRRDVIAQAAWEWEREQKTPLTRMVGWHVREGRIRNGRAVDSFTRETLTRLGWKEAPRKPQVGFVGLSERELALMGEAA